MNKLEQAKKVRGRGGSRLCLWVLAAVVLGVAVFLGSLAWQPKGYHVDESGRIVFTDLENPKHPLFLAVLHALVTPLASHLPPLEESSLLSAAQQRANLSDFGPFADLGQEGLRRLLDSVSKEAHISPLGSQFVREFFISRLVAQLRHTQLIKEHPEILDEQVDDPLIIAGLPRTGTTNLHALLASSGDFRYVRFYEGSHTFEFPPNASSNIPDPRIAQTADELWFLRTATPLLPLMVNFTAESQVEEVYVEANVFASMLFETIFHCPSYSKWYTTIDQMRLLGYLKSALQTMQWLDRRASADQASFTPRRWLLKSPSYFERLPAVLQVFPRAHVVVTHRNPLEIVKSVTTMMTYLMRLYSNRVQPAAASRLWTNRVTLMLDRHMAQRAQTAQHAGRVLECMADEYWADPAGLVRRIYALTNASLSDASLARIERYIAEHPRQGAQAIHYSLDAVGLTVEEMQARHGAVLAQYDALLLSLKAGRN
jgi:hypothetical protein